MLTRGKFEKFFHQKRTFDWFFCREMEFVLKKKKGGEKAPPGPNKRTIGGIPEGTRGHIHFKLPWGHPKTGENCGEKKRKEETENSGVNASKEKEGISLEGKGK